MRLIDADALKSNFDPRTALNGAAVICEINDAPTIDAAPVVHGRWIQVQQLRGNPGWEIGQCWSEIVYQCSICERISAHKEPYCHCGARMDAKEDEPV